MAKKKKVSKKKAVKKSTKKKVVKKKAVKKKAKATKKKAAKKAKPRTKKILGHVATPIDIEIRGLAASSEVDHGQDALLDNADSHHGDADVDDGQTSFPVDESSSDVNEGDMNAPEGQF